MRLGRRRVTRSPPIGKRICVLAGVTMVFLFSRSTDHYLPSRETTGPLFSVYVLIAWGSL